MNSNLTTRERDVLKLTSFGYSQKEAADKLGISRFTIDTHIKKIKQKTGLQKSTELELAYVFSTYHLPLTDLPALLRSRLQMAFTAMSFKQLLRLHRATGSSQTNLARGIEQSTKFEKITMAAFAILFALITIAAITGAAMGYTWHAYTAICTALTTAVCISEFRKIK